MFKRIKRRIFELIEPAAENDIQSKTFDIFIIILVLLNVVAIIISSFSGLSLRVLNLLDIFEMCSIVVFTIEYILRVFTANIIFYNYGIMKAIICFIFTPMALIDFFAIIPFYLPFIVSIDLRFLRILRLTRLLRVFKINRYSKSLQLLGRVLKEKKEELFVTVFITMLLMLLAASVMYFVESDVQPESFPNIIASFWWAIATLTTVGYGDVYPITVFGKILAGLIALLGIGLVAMPTGIISSGFIEIYNKDKNQNKKILKRHKKKKNNYKRRPKKTFDV